MALARSVVIESEVRCPRYLGRVARVTMGESPAWMAQRLVKAAIASSAAPYSDDELATIAAHCTERENAANRVERFDAEKEEMVSPRV